eukprot:TRINITY_DN21885_c0_g4_i1.p1 TRINITY_DN21885_c0_g4~~TRINITY_DN21885_c0_g4_i1.p1  ORF type:complete len:362 (+),score=52.29 TRINITY_DN21885_c0_g4_i1:267-1352(+)
MPRLISCFLSSVTMAKRGLEEEPPKAVMKAFREYLKEEGREIKGTGSRKKLRTAYAELDSTEREYFRLVAGGYKNFGTGQKTIKQSLNERTVGTKPTPWILEEENYRFMGAIPIENVLTANKDHVAQAEDKSSDDEQHTATEIYSDGQGNIDANTAEQAQAQTDKFLMDPANSLYATQQEGGGGGRASSQWHGWDSTWGPWQAPWWGQGHYGWHNMQASTNKTMGVASSSNTQPQQQGYVPLHGNLHDAACTPRVSLLAKAGIGKRTNKQTYINMQVKALECGRLPGWEEISFMAETHPMGNPLLKVHTQAVPLGHGGFQISDLRRAWHVKVWDKKGTVQISGKKAEEAAEMISSWAFRVN